MYNFIEILCIVSELWMLYLFLNAFYFTSRQTLAKTAVSFCLFGAGVTILSFMPGVAFLRILFVFAGLTIGISNRILVERGFARSLYLIIGHFILFAIFIFVCLLIRRSADTLSFKTVLPLLPCWSVSIVLSCLLAWQYVHTDDNMPALYLFVMLGLLYTNIIFLYFTSQLTKHALHEKELELTKHHYLMQKKYYDNLYQQNEEVRALWHDLNKYIRAIQTDSDNQALQDVTDRLNSVTQLVDVQNHTLNVILNEYLQIAKEHQTKLSMDIRVPAELNVNTVDLYIIIGNTLDNAIRACDILPPEERTIFIKMKMHHRVMYYETRNPYPQNQSLQNKDSLHGYGLKNVRNCLDHYYGYMKTSVENRQFIFQCHLNT